MKGKTNDLSYDLTFSAHTINVCATVEDQCLEYLVYVALAATLKKNWAKSALKIFQTVP